MAGALLALGTPGAVAQLYQGNAATIRPGEIADGMFAASNAFAEGTEITVRNLESGVAVEVEVVARVNGGLLLLLLAPTAADAIGIGAGEIVLVDAKLTSIAVDAGAQAAAPGTSDDPDVDPAAGLPDNLADYLASLPPVDVAVASTEGDSESATDIGEGTDASTVQEGASDSTTPDRVDAEAPPVLSGVPDEPDSGVLDTSSALANAEAGADQLLEPAGVAEANAAQATDLLGDDSRDDRLAALSEPQPPESSTEVRPSQELLGVDTPPDAPPETTDVIAAADLDTPPSDAAASAPPPLALFGVNQTPALPLSSAPQLATVAAEPSPPSQASAGDTEADVAPTAYTTATPIGEAVTATTPPHPAIYVESLTTSPPLHPPDEELLALLAVPEPTREAVARAESTAELPIAVTRVALVELTEPRPPVASADSLPAPITGEALAEPILESAAVSDASYSADAVAPADQTSETTVEVAGDVERSPPTDTAAADLAPLQEAVTDSAPSGLTGAGALDSPPSVDGPVYLLQLGAFASQSGAQNVAMRVPRSFAPAVVGSEGDRPVFKVMIGPLNRDESGTLLYRFRASGFPDAFLVPIPAEELAQAPAER